MMARSGAACGKQNDNILGSVVAPTSWFDVVACFICFRRRTIVGVLQDNVGVILCTTHGASVEVPNGVGELCRARGSAMGAQPVDAASRC